MPILKKIAVSNFRNIEFQELEFSPNVNCISGGNGEGKTNLLDAIYYLSMTKSAFSNTDKYNFRHGTDVFSLCGTYLMHPETATPEGTTAEEEITKFAIQVNALGEKKLKKDDQTYNRVSDQSGTLPIVMVSPSDISLVSDSGDQRRKFVNSVLSQMDREYLSAAQQYNRLLAQRNTLLKGQSPDTSLLSVIDARMAAPARKIFEARKSFMEGLRPVIADYYRVLSSDSEQVDVEYRSELCSDGSSADSPLSIEDLFSRNLRKDLAMGYTTSGIQRDDFVFTMGGHPIRRCGSQGQQKSFIVSLKFAQYDLMKENYGFAPTLLLDDVFDKLDIDRISNLLSMVAGNEFGQIFITDSNKVRLSGILDKFTSDRAYFETSGGNFSRL